MRPTRNSSVEDSKQADAVPFTRKLRSVSKRVTLVQNVKNEDSSLLKEKLNSAANQKNKIKKHKADETNEHSNFSIEEGASLLSKDNEPTSKKLKTNEHQRQNKLESSESALISEHSDHRRKGEALPVGEANKPKSKSKNHLKQNEHFNFSTEEGASLLSKDIQSTSKKLKTIEHQRQNELESSESALISEHSDHRRKGEAVLVCETNKPKSKSKKHLKQSDCVLNESNVIFTVPNVQKSTDAKVEATILRVIQKSVNIEVGTTDSAVKSTESLTDLVQNMVDIPTLPKTSIDGNQFNGKIRRSKVIASKGWHPYVKIGIAEMEICRRPIEKLMATKQKIAEHENEPDIQIPIELETPLSSEVSGIEILNHNRNTELDSNLMKIDNDNSVSIIDCASNVNATTDIISSAVNIANGESGCEVNVTNACVMNEVIDELADNLLKSIDETVNEADILSATAVSEVDCAVLPVSEFPSAVNNIIGLEVLGENIVSESVDKDNTNVPKKTVKCVYEFTDSSSESEHEYKCPDSSPEREPEKGVTECDNDEMHEFAVLPKSPTSGIAGNDSSEFSEVKEIVEQTPVLGEEIVNYFNRKHFDNKMGTQILQFIKDFDFVSEKSHDYALCVLNRDDEQSIDLLGFSQCQEVPLSLYSPFNSTKARELVSNCVKQIIRCITWAISSCSTDKKSVSSDFVPLQVVLQHQHIENFFNQIQDYEISKVYAQSYTFFLNFIVNESKCSLTPHNQDSLEKIRLILNEVINCKEIVTVESINSNNLVTQHPEILKRVREHLLIEGEYKDHETLFVLQYLHAFLRLELRKPTWVFKDANFYEYKNAVDLEDCKVMVVYNNCKYLKRFQTVIWRREALQLVDRYVCGGKKCSSGNLFQDALYRKFASQIEDDKFINSYYQDDGGKLKPVGHSKEVHVQTVEPETRATEKKSVRTVGIQCSFQITLEGNNNLPLNDNYTVNLDQGVKSSFVLVPTRKVEGKQVLPTFVDAGVDPIVIPRRHVQAQTSLAIINRFTLKEQETQTEDEINTEDEIQTEDEIHVTREIPSESEIQIESEFQAEVQIKNETENSNLVESEHLNSKHVPKSSLIKSVQHALQCWPPTTDGIPLSLEETGFTREIYFTNYYKQFVEAQIKLRAKVIVDEIAARRKTLKSEEVSAIAKKYNWPVTTLLMYSCLSKGTS